RLRPSRDNLLVRSLKRLALWNLGLCLRHRALALGGVGLLLALTLAALPFLGREFMPELEEGNLYIRGTFPVNISLEAVSGRGPGGGLGGRGGGRAGRRPGPAGVQQRGVLRASLAGGGLARDGRAAGLEALAVRPPPRPHQARADQTDERGAGPEAGGGGLE